MYNNQRNSLLGGNYQSNAPAYGGTIPTPMYGGSLLQPAQPVQQSVPTLNGFVTDNIRNVRPSDVPMDGSVSLFPDSTYNVIYAKAWNDEGNIDTVKFIRESAIIDQLNRIESMLAGINRKPNHQNGQGQKNTGNNKEVNNNV